MSNCHYTEFEAYSEAVESIFLARCFHPLAE